MNETLLIIFLEMKPLWYGPSIVASIGAGLLTVGFLLFGDLSEIPGFFKNIKNGITKLFYKEY